MFFLNSRLCSISFFLDCSLSSCRLANIVAVASSSLCQQKQNKKKKRNYSQKSVSHRNKKSSYVHHVIRNIKTAGLQSRTKHQASRNWTFWITSGEVLQPCWFYLATEISLFFSRAFLALAHHHTGYGSSVLYTPPSNFQTPGKVTDLWHVQARFISTRLLFEDAGFSLFESIFFSQSNSSIG